MRESKRTRVIECQVGRNGVGGEAWEGEYKKDDKGGIMKEAW